MARNGPWCTEDSVLDVNFAQLGQCFVLHDGRCAQFRPGSSDHSVHNSKLGECETETHPNNIGLYWRFHSTGAAYKKG